MSDTKLKTEEGKKKLFSAKFINKKRMESLGLIHGLAFVTLVTGIIFLFSVSLYLRSDRSKYDLYRPGHSSVEDQNVNTQYNQDSTDSSLSDPVYKDEIKNLNKELNLTISDQSGKTIFKDEDLSDENLLRPVLDITQ